MKYQFYKLFWYLVDLIFPPTCGGCQVAGVRWCDKCQEETKRIIPPVCEICGQAVQTNLLCSRCRTSPPLFKAVRAWAEFDGPIRYAIHNLKYRKNIGLGASIAQPLVCLFHQYYWTIDMVTTVPLGKERQKHRGYSQAPLLAQPLAHDLKLPYNPRILRRGKETQSQVELSFVERQNNVKDAFQATNQALRRKQILIIDDVTTSGSTINACADTLLKFGTKAVFGLTVARPVMHS